MLIKIKVNTLLHVLYYEEGIRGKYNFVTVDNSHLFLILNR
nr:MAG TPA: hypothetical protein [Caudoviricetes sp.]